MYTFPRNKSHYDRNKLLNLLDQSVSHKKTFMFSLSYASGSDWTLRSAAFQMSNTRCNAESVSTNLGSVLGSRLQRLLALILSP